MRRNFRTILSDSSNQFESNNFVFHISRISVTVDARAIPRVHYPDMWDIHFSLFITFVIHQIAFSEKDLFFFFSSCYVYKIDLYFSQYDFQAILSDTIITPCRFYSRFCYETRHLSACQKCALRCRTASTSSLGNLVWLALLLHAFHSMRSNTMQWPFSEWRFRFISIAMQPGSSFAPRGSYLVSFFCMQIIRHLPTWRFVSYLYPHEGLPPRE